MCSLAKQSLNVGSRLYHSKLVLGLSLLSSGIVETCLFALFLRVPYVASIFGYNITFGAYRGFFKECLGQAYRVGSQPAQDGGRNRK